MAACDAAGAPKQPVAADAAVVQAVVAPPAGPNLSDAYFEAYLAETVKGDQAAARAGYGEVLDGARDRDPELAARAALRLAELEAQSGRRREALDLVARALALGIASPAVLDAAEALRVRLASVEGDDAPVRGPAAGTALDGVTPEAAEHFRRAEELLVAYHAIPVRPRLEELTSALRRKGRALEDAVRAYKKVAALGQPTATCAAEFRMASLYHDYALSQAFEFPPELLPELVEALRKNLRRSASSYLRKAATSYAAALAVAETPASAPWRAPAAAGARSADDLLRRLE